jgi:hypothetical protein
MTRAALRRALAMLGVVATLAAMVPPATPAGAAAPDETSGSAHSSEVNRNAVEPKTPRQQETATSDQSGDSLGASPQPVWDVAGRVGQAVDTAVRPVFTARATSLVAAHATIAAQPRAPPFSRT